MSGYEREEVPEEISSKVFVPTVGLVFNHLVSHMTQQCLTRLPTLPVGYAVRLYSWASEILNHLPTVYIQESAPHLLLPPAAHCQLAQTLRKLKVTHELEFRRLRLVVFWAVQGRAMKAIGEVFEGEVRSGQILNYKINKGSDEKQLIKSFQWIRESFNSVKLASSSLRVNIQHK